MYRRFLKLSLIACLILAGLIILSCGSKTKTNPETIEIKNPAGLVLVYTIEGTIGGLELTQPRGITSDQSGNIYLVDGGNHRLIWLNRDFEVIRDAAGFGRDEGLLNSPAFLALDNNLNLYVSDVGNQRIDIFDSKLNFVDYINLIDEDDPLKFGPPGGVTTNQHGEIWVTDPENSRIMVFNNYGNFDRFIGDVRSYAGAMTTPQAISRSKSGFVYVSDIKKSELIVFDEFGILETSFGIDQTRKPGGIDFDRFGNIWIVDSELPGVLCFDRDYYLSLSQGSYGSEGDYAFRQPFDITILPDDHLAVSDTGNDRILIYKILYP